MLTVPSSDALRAAAPPADVFALDSRPGSPRVIYLDFDGHTASDPAWASVDAPATIVSAAYNPDGVPGLSVDERARIFEIWQRVAEDFRPFDVNVTTRDPGAEALQRRPETDQYYGQRVVITPSNFAGAGVLGVALVNVFAADVDHATYVFAGTAFAAAAKTVAEAVSHETGHTFGLRHDGVGTPGSYYDGHGSWAPIMGRSVDPSRTVTQWSRGEYAGANQPEDDLAEIAARTGYRSDDHGDTPASATIVGASSVTGGDIEHTGDRDVFAVDLAAGAMSAALRPPSGQGSWSNLAARLTVRDAAGTTVATGSPALSSGWAVELNAVVPAGRYTLEVDPVGWMTPATGFSTYGSLGAYELSVDGGQGERPMTSDVSTLTPVTPIRLVDTRNGIGSLGRVGAGRQIVVDVAGDAAVPPDATAAVFTIAAVDASAAGFLTAYPCSDVVPDTSTLNYVAGQTVANTTIAALSNAGQLCVWTSAETDILIDLTGWLGPGGTSRLTPIGPTRVVDTRSAIGGRRLAAGATMEVDLGGVVPAGSTAVALNVTGVDASVPGFITVFPCNGAVPNTSTINYVADEARPNNTIVGLTGGRVCIYSDAATEVLVDLLGAFGPSGFGYEPTPPIRVLDTRRSATLGAGAAVAYQIGAAALGGRTPGAAYVNVTGANHTVAGYVTTYDCITRRDTSTVNQKVGQAAANGAIVPLSGLESCAWTDGGGDLIVDLNGWWVP